MMIGRMAVAVLDWQQGHLAEVVFRQPDLAIEDGDQVLILEFLRTCFWPVALEAELARSCGAQQMLIVSAVRLMAGGAALRPGWLMQVSLLHLVCLIAVAGQAGVDWIRLNESRALSAMRIVAGDAFARGARMLHLRGLDLLGLIFVTGQAKSAAVTIGQDDLAFLRCLVTAVAHLVLERVVQECLHQLRFRGLVRVVALQTIRGSERLPLVS